MAKQAKPDLPMVRLDKNVNFCSKMSNYNLMPRVYNKLGLITKPEKIIVFILFRINSLTY